MCFGVPRATSKVTQERLNHNLNARTVRWAVWCWKHRRIWIRYQALSKRKSTKWRKSWCVRTKASFWQVWHRTPTASQSHVRSSKSARSTAIKSSSCNYISKSYSSSAVNLMKRQPISAQSSLRSCKRTTLRYWRVSSLTKRSFSLRFKRRSWLYQQVEASISLIWRLSRSSRVYSATQRLPRIWVWWTTNNQRSTYSELYTLIQAKKADWISSAVSSLFFPWLIAFPIIFRWTHR